VKLKFYLVADGFGVVQYTLLDYAKLTEAQVRQIKQLLADGKLTQKTIGSQFNVSKGTVQDIKSGRRWSHLNYHLDKKDAVA
jgi:hypothetical protein